MVCKAFYENQQGMGRLRILIIALFLIIVVFVANQVIPFFYYFYEIEGLMQSQAAKGSVFSDQEIRKTIMEKINKLELPIDDEDALKINRFNGKIVIDLEYDEVLYVDFGEGRSYDLWVFHFAPHAEHTL